MPWIIAGGALLGGLMSSSATSSAASTQAGAAQAGIDEQRRQFAEVQKLLAPYVQAGQGAIGGFQPYQAAGRTAFEQQMALLGLAPETQEQGGGGGGGGGFFGGGIPGIGNIFSSPSGQSIKFVGGESGRAAQQAAINQIEQNPLFQSQIRQGEEALLQRASATGGLRGGNIQAALAQFRPQMLQQAIEQQYGRLGGIAGTGLGVTEQLYRGGQASATGQASAAGTLGSNVANLLGQQGAAQAGGQLAGAAPFANLLGMPLQMAGMNYARTGQFGMPSFGNLFGGGAGQYNQAMGVNFTAPGTYG